MTGAFSVRLARDVISARGADARSFLHSQLSNDIASLAAGSSKYSFVLEPTGKLSAFMRVRCVSDEHFEIDVDEGCGTAALARLNKFKIRVKCEFELSTQPVLGLRGLDASSRTAALAVPGTVAAWREGDGAVDVFGGDAPAIAASMSAALADDVGYNAERVRCCWPIFGVDIDADTIPAETSLVDVCVSFTKGCYPGQELVERMDSRGSTAPRMLMRLPARPNGAGGATSGTVTAIAGEPYMLSGQPIGRCTSVAGDFALVMVTRAHLGDAVALASP